ncbi:uncharacterized protein LOC129773034 [Toxorhynchites rutilus septentrionalis]|uniref:uncharacterized protein LOC129773034 n=1 Tax=Toxorhynchites rutilus septentrionalis TaxID=329112 RepID=UPI00247AE676|nr:uncharacterized protein LOC129773034 [Toxorhynchites rutilus septentrionalis]
MASNFWSETKAVRGDEKSKWKLWKISFDWYASSVELEKLSGKRHVAVFLSCLGPEIIDVYESFELTAEQTVVLKTVSDKFAEYFDAHDNPIYESYLFNKITQEEGETVGAFLIRLRAQAKKCKYTENGQELINRLIRDRLISGIQSEVLRTKLLEDNKITLQKAVDVCKANEAAVEQNKLIAESASGSSNEVHVVKSFRAPKEKMNKCAWCGRSHRPRECLAYGKKCNKCGKTGHFRSVCRSKSNADAKMLDREEDESDDEEKIVDALRVFAVNTLCPPRRPQQSV